MSPDAANVLRFVIGATLQLLAMAGVGYLFWRWLRSGKPHAIAPPITTQANGRRGVPIIASFTGIKGLPWVAVAFNNLHPRLELGPDGLTTRVIRTRERAYAAIEEVDVRVFGATVNLRFAFAGSPLTFDANVGSIALAAQLLRLLPDNVPRSSRALVLQGAVPA